MLFFFLSIMRLCKSGYRNVYDRENSSEVVTWKTSGTTHVSIIFDIHLIDVGGGFLLVLIDQILNHLLLLLMMIYIDRYERECVYR